MTKEVDDDTTELLAKVVVKKLTGWNTAKVLAFIGVVIGTAVPYIHPSSVMDKEAMTEAVDSVFALRLEHVEEEAKRAIAKVDVAVDKLETRMRNDLDGVKESVKDKVQALRDAVMSRKDLIQEQLKHVATSATANKSTLQKLELSIAQLEQRIRELEQVAQAMDVMSTGLMLDEEHDTFNEVHDEGP
jgi:methyl-accepting chemotaxis protein